MLKVMVVDDEEDTVDLTGMFLTAEGFIPVPALSCAEAIRACQEDVIDVVIMDLTLSDGNAADLLARMGDRRPRVVILVSGWENARAKCPDVDDAFTKPLDMRLAFQRIRELAETKSRSV